ncbi:hypothetical protein R8H71_002750 [Providencia rettgeri]|nr:hypothetical protein [Providencia rettgeri]
MICTGKSYYDAEYKYNEDGEHELDYVIIIKPQFFTPPLKYITIPRECPQAVKDNLIEAFYLTPLSLSSTVNRIRIAIENLLNSFKIPKTKIIKGHRKRLNLHERIRIGSSKIKVLGRLEEAMTAFVHFPLIETL